MTLNYHGKELQVRKPLLQREKDPRIKGDGYGYTIEGFYIKCVGKAPYTITFYSPQGYLYGDEHGDLKEGDKEGKHPWNKPSYAVGRGQYWSQAQYSDDNRLGQNTKNLAKPLYPATLPFRYPRACLPVPPVDLKDPTGGGEPVISSIKTNGVNKYIGDIFNSKVIKGKNEETEIQRVLVAYWEIPVGARGTIEDIPITTLIQGQIVTFKAGFYPNEHPYYSSSEYEITIKDGYGEREYKKL